MEPRIRVPGPPRWFSVSGRLCGTRLGLPGGGAAVAGRQSCCSGVHARWHQRERDGGRESNACSRPIADSWNDALRIQNRKKFCGVPIQSHHIGAPHNRYVQAHQQKPRPGSCFSCGSVVLQLARTPVPKETTQATQGRFRDFSRCGGVVLEQKAPRYCHRSDRLADFGVRPRPRDLPIGSPWIGDPPPVLLCFVLSTVSRLGLAS
jgi:hypothetical protein